MTGINSDEKIYLALSGGGFRAAARHLGSLIYLLESGFYRNLAVVSSVSGGSIAASYFAKWLTINQTPADVLSIEALRSLAVPFFQFLRTNVRNRAILKMATLQQIWRTSTAFSDILDDHLLNGFLLSQVPTNPTFIFCATDTADGSPAYFSSVGLTRRGGHFLPRIFHMDAPRGSIRPVLTLPENFTLSMAVAASSAYPLLFAPVRFKADARQYYFLYRKYEEGNAIYRTDSSSSMPKAITLRLADGGISDNLGIQPLITEPPSYSRKDTGISKIICFNSGYPDLQGKYPPRGCVSGMGTAFQSLNWSMAQRQLLAIFYLKQLTYGTQMEFHLSSPDTRYYPLLDEATLPLSAIRTDLDSLSDIEAFGSIWLGYTLAERVINEAFIQSRYKNRIEQLEFLLQILKGTVDEDRIRDRRGWNFHLRFSHFRLGIRRSASRTMMRAFKRTGLQSDRLSPRTWY